MSATTPEPDSTYWGRFHALQELECLLAAKLRAVKSARGDAERANAAPSIEYLAAKEKVVAGLSRLLSEAQKRAITANEWRHAMGEDEDQ